MRSIMRSLLWFIPLVPLLLTNGCSPEHQPKSTPSQVESTAATPSPNIIFVLTDDLSWNLVEYMPAVQKMMARGMTFSNYFVTDSWCCPSRASIFTGKYPHDTKVFTNTGELGGYATFERVGNQRETFAIPLAAAGYQAAIMGKYLNGYDPGENSADPGWSEWDVAGGSPKTNLGEDFRES